MTELPRVTVLIPARNEETDIERCLRAVLAQDYPHDRIQVVVVDGGSIDRTVPLAVSVLDGSVVVWTVCENPAATTPSNLNAGLALAAGEVLCRVDARSVVPSSYVRLCASVLRERPEVAVTGGAQVAVAVDSSPGSVGIARALNNRLATGGSRYRSGAPSGPSDTVYLGAFRTRELRDAGGWDEYFETNQDYELNRRMGRRGLVWFDARLEVGYVPRQSLVALWHQYHRFGRWKVRYWRRTGDTPQARQLAPLIVVPTVMLLGVCTVVSSKRPFHAFAAAAAASAVGLLTLDTIGCTMRVRDPVGARVVGSMAVAAVGSGWVSGVFRQALARTDRRSIR